MSKEEIFREVCKIPKGETKTYKEIAIAIKTSPRVVARILSQNQHPIKIPCHRVVCSNGKPGGYTFKGKKKLGMKIKLLRKEGVRIKDNKIVNWRRGKVGAV